MKSAELIPEILLTFLSYDDIFIKRLFASYIVKQSNPEDQRIRDYVDNGLDRLYEAQRIKKNLTDFEQDLWSYWCRFDNPSIWRWIDHAGCSIYCVVHLFGTQIVVYLFIMQM